MRDRDLFDTKPRGRAWFVAALVWGFAEATLFFIVPDVLLSWMALERPKRALVACLVATAGALGGGALTYAWGHSDAEAARAAMVRIPGIDERLVGRVDADMEVRGLDALVLGPARGRPYKLYAVAWGARGGDLVAFLAVSVPARLLRFLALTLLAAGVRRYGLAKWPLAACRALLIVIWIAFYAWYFHAMAA